MNNQEKLKIIREKAKKDAEKLFKEKTKDVQKELEKTFNLGNPKNLIKPDNKDE
jgi:hypothetical protein